MLGRIAGAAFRVARQALPKGVRPWHTPHGVVYLDAAESWMMAARIVGLYERRKLQIIARLPVGGVFVDVGSNRGDFSLAAANQVGPSGKVLAVEPEPTNANDIRRTMAANAVEHVEIVEKALSDRSGNATLAIGPRSGFHSMFPEGRFQPAGFVNVEVTTLDELVSKIGRVDMIKVDVEGAELEVLHGGIQTFRQHRPIVLMDVDRTGTAAQYTEFFTSVSYRTTMPGWKHLIAIPED